MVEDPESSFEVTSCISEVDLDSESSVVFTSSLEASKLSSVSLTVVGPAGFVDSVNKIDCNALLCRSHMEHKVFVLVAGGLIVESFESECNDSVVVDEVFSSSESIVVRGFVCGVDVNIGDFEYSSEEDNTSELVELPEHFRQEGELVELVKLEEESIGFVDESVELVELVILEAGLIELVD